MRVTLITLVSSVKVTLSTEAKKFELFETYKKILIASRRITSALESYVFLIKKPIENSYSEGGHLPFHPGERKLKRVINIARRTLLK